MVKKVINPVTRISGFLEIEVEIEGGQVVEAKTGGLLFRGFELMLQGRNPLDAIYFTQRICGICSTAHAMGAALALESALQVTPSPQGKALRDLIHSCEFLQNHLRHFYLYTLPDFISLPQDQALFQDQSFDRRLPPAVNQTLVEHYFQALDYSRWAHQMLALLGGKAPHDHGVFIGGITVVPTVDKLVKFASLLAKIKTFVEASMIPDVYTVAKYYDDYFHLGQGYGNLLSYGVFDQYQDLPNLYVQPEVYLDGQKQPLDAGKIAEYINFAWFSGVNPQEPSQAVTQPEFPKDAAYSWTKAPRYQQSPCEVGPLARMILCGEYETSVSMMDRTIARVLEVKKIIGIMERLLEYIQLDQLTQEIYAIPPQAQGVGLTDTTRGALGHWCQIDSGVLSHYQVVTPSAWNLSPRDDQGQRGVAEAALVGTPIQNIDCPIEITRIVRSFDPCISCATHVQTAKGKQVWQIV